MIRLLLAAFTITGVIVSAPALPLSETASPMMAAVATYTLPPLLECDYGCGECPVGSYHETYTSSEWELYSSGIEACEPRTHGCPYHIACGLPDNENESTSIVLALEDNPEFWTTLGEADGDTLKAFLANNAHRATFNPERRSIQVLGCTEQVRVNIPLSPEQVVSLDTSD
jgi:hypothetical protein